MKKIVCSLLFVFLCAGLHVSVGAEATEGSGDCGPDVHWKYADGVLEIFGNGAMDRHAVSSLYPWHSFRNMCVEAVISDGVTNIASYALADCVALNSVTIPKTVTDIGTQAFQGCKSLTSVSLPHSVTSIGDSAFCDCSSLEQINIPNGVTVIRDRTFYGCSSLRDIEFPNSVESLGYWAFRNCASLTEITLPKYIVNLSPSVFDGCSGITNITMPAALQIQDTDYYNDTFNGCVAIAFVHMTGSGPMPDTPSKYMPWRKGLEAGNSVVVEFDDGLTNIGAETFQDCANQKGTLSITSIPDSVISIGVRAFAHCAGLQISLPPNLKSVGDSAFEDCDGMTGDFSSLESITSLGRWAFKGCAGLTGELRVSEELTEISGNAFANCSGMTKLSLSSGVRTVQGYAFQGCAALAWIYLPLGVQSIQEGAFFRCDNLKDVYCAGGEEDWNGISIDASWGRNDSLYSAKRHYYRAAPEFFFPSAPTISGGASITRANVGTLTQITVPVAYSGDTAQTVTFAVPFYDGSGKFIGVGMKTETVTSSTQSVTVPVSGLSGSESMKVMILGDTFNPLSPVGSYSLPA